MSFRLQCKAGRLSLDSFLSTSSSFSELQFAISKKTGVHPNKQKILFGYPPKEVYSYDRNNCIASLGIKRGDVLFLQELEVARSSSSSNSAVTPPEEETVATNESPSNSKRIPVVADDDTPPSPPSYTSDKLEGNLTRKVVPADNSCLFRSISTLLCKEMTCVELRELVAGVITSQPDVYSQVFLGRPNEDYVSWILKDDSWGGAIELVIFSKLFTTELDVVDIQTKRIEKFGEDQFYHSRALLIYDGIHYDPLVLADRRGNILQSIFPVSNERIVWSALELAEEANRARQFTDVANFSLRCLVCNQLFKGHVDAENHAKATGHINFGEV